MKQYAPFLIFLLGLMFFAPICLLAAKVCDWLMSLIPLRKSEGEAQ